MPDNFPTVAVIQARMSSSRLPGKVLMPIAGLPLLWHIVHRLRQCQSVDMVAVATSTDARDDAIAQFCAAESVICVHGSLDNVLDRYRLAAEQTGARTILRVTGDTSLIDPGFVDYLVSALGTGDFAMLAPGALCAHDGVDVLSRRALDWLTAHAADDPVAREHVSSYFKLHPDVVKTVTVPPYPLLAFPHERFSIDTQDDLTLIRALYEKLGAPAGELKLADALKVMRDEPSYRAINAHVRQKAIDQVERHALICCQGGQQAGLGHVRGSLSLARALRDQEGFGVTIGVRGDARIMDMFHAAAFETFALDNAVSLMELAAQRNFSFAVLDLKDWLTQVDVAALRGPIPIVAVIDDIGERRLAASHAYYPPVPDALELSWADSTCVPRIGWEWCVLGFDPSRISIPVKPQGATPRLVISMGGADPFNKTALVLPALQRLTIPFEASFIIGPAFSDPAGVASTIGKAGANFHALEGVANPAEIFATADLALVSFGVTAYELAALGVPAIYLPIFPDHARSASVFVAEGLGLLLAQSASAEDIAAAVEGLIGDARLASMRRAGPKILDGMGAGRIAADLAKAANLALRQGK